MGDKTRENSSVNSNSTRSYYVVWMMDSIYAALYIFYCADCFYFIVCVVSTLKQSLHCSVKVCDYVFLPFWSHG
jgi:hypothetical protein